MELLIGPLLKMIGFDYKNKRKKDGVLFETLINDLPSDSDAIRMLKEKDFGDPILRDDFSPLYKATI